MLNVTFTAIFCIVTQEESADQGNLEAKADRVHPGLLDLLVQ